MKKNKLSSFFAMVLVLCLALSLASCGGTSPADIGAAGSGASGGTTTDGVFRLGFCSPLTGANGEAGTETLNSVKAYVERLNANGGLNGQQIELIIYDDEADPATSLSAMTKLCTSDNVNAIIGSIMSSCVIGAIDTIQQYGVPTITGGMSPTLTEQGCTYLFRDVINQDYPLAQLVDAVVASGVKKVAIFTLQDESQIVAGDRFEAAMKEHGIEVTAREYGNDTDTDYTAQCANLIASKPEAIFYKVTTPASPLFVKQIRDLGYAGPLWLGESFQLNGIQVAGAASDYVCFAWPMVTVESIEDAINPVMEDFLTVYVDMFGSVPTTDCAYRAWDGMRILEEGCRIAGSNDRDAIADGIRQIKDFDLLGGKSDFTSGTGEGYQTAQLFYVKDGKYHDFTEWFESGGYDEWYASVMG